MERTPPPLRIVSEETPWNRPEAYRADPIEMLRQRARDHRPTLRDDWHDFISEVRGSPYSHALVAILTIIAWTALLVAPTLLGAGK
jgi:hypothetical protein